MSSVFVHLEDNCADQLAEQLIRIALCISVNIIY